MTILNALTLGEITETLGGLPDLPIVYAHSAPFMHLGRYPTLQLDSWRGVYAHLALGHTDTEHDDERRPITTAALWRYLTSRIGTIVQGYKGGDYEIDRDQEVFVDNWSEARGGGILGVGVHRWTAYDPDGHLVVALHTGGTAVPL